MIEILVAESEEFLHHLEWAVLQGDVLEPLNILHMGGHLLLCWPWFWHCISSGLPTFAFRPPLRAYTITCAHTYTCGHTHTHVDTHTHAICGVTWSAGTPSKWVYLLPITWWETMCSVTLLSFGFCFWSKTFHLLTPTDLQKKAGVQFPGSV